MLAVARELNVPKESSSLRRENCIEPRCTRFPPAPLATAASDTTVKLQLGDVRKHFSQAGTNNSMLANSLSKGRCIEKV